jgi:hypothetical protein
VSVAEQGRSVAVPTPLRNPDQLAVTQGEGNEIARSVVELLARVEMLESQLRAVASVFGAAELLGDEPTDGRGLGYVRARVDLVDKGRWGEHGIDRFLEEQAEARRQPIFDPTEMEEAALRRAYWDEAKKMGATLLSRRIGGPIEQIDWPPDLADWDGRKRAAEAKRRALAAVAASKNGGKK